MTHGTRSCYTYHRCRCDECRAANAAYTAAWHRKKRGVRERRVSSEPTIARLDSLKRAGIHANQVARMMGYKFGYMKVRRQYRVRSDTEEKVRIIHDYFVHGKRKDSA